MGRTLHRLNQYLNRTKAQKYKLMDTLELTFHKHRKARTRSMIQLGALISTAGLVETFGITLGKDLQ